MLLSTTSHIEGRPVESYLGVVGGDTILGANVFRDFFAGVRDLVGGRAGGYEAALRSAKQMALEDMQREAAELGANAVIGIDIDYETVRQSMLMVSCSGTAVRLKD